MQYLHKQGRSLNTAVKAYNDLVGSLERGVLPQMRKLEGLGILAPGTHLPDAPAIEAQTCPISFAAGLTSGHSLLGESDAQEGLEQLPQG
jgi:DNA anti-recombination protein RmuC